MAYLSISAYVSLIIQLITGFIEFQGVIIPDNQIKESDLIVRDVLTMELIVQVIEFIFYIYLVYKIITGHISSSITSHRYADWSLTTPVMLISFIIFFKYLNNPNRKIRLWDSLKEEKENIIKIVVANALMLLFGLLGELEIINPCLGVAIGFIPFAYLFKILYSNYVNPANVSNSIFYASFLIWSLYGVAAVLPFDTKNTFYNILDLFAKNAYGLFLYFYIEKYRLV
jgi:bacteriorhodopsin